MERTEFMGYLDGKLGRTEEQVLNSFRRFGCINIYKNDHHKSLVLDYMDGEYIEIWLESKRINLSRFKSIHIEELKLINELFEIWGWLEK